MNQLEVGPQLPNRFPEPSEQSKHWWGHFTGVHCHFKSITSFVPQNPEWLHWLNVLLNFSLNAQLDMLTFFAVIPLYSDPSTSCKMETVQYCPEREIFSLKFLVTQNANCSQWIKKFSINSDACSWRIQTVHKWGRSFLSSLIPQHELLIDLFKTFCTV